jgi:hypothetical protein
MDWTQEDDHEFWPKQSEEWNSNLLSWKTESEKHLKIYSLAWKEPAKESEKHSSEKRKIKRVEYLKS